jgi:hypothetical protein
MKDKTRIHYDEDGDYLEISVGEPAKCYAEEIEPGVFIRLDNETGEAKSIGILDFRKRAQSEDFELKLPIGFDLTQIKKKLSKKS